MLTWLVSRWRRPFVNLVMGQSTNVTHQPKLAISPFLTLQHVTVDIGDHGVGVYNAVMDVGCDQSGIYCELGLRVSG